MPHETRGSWLVARGSWFVSDDSRFTIHESRKRLRVLLLLALFSMLSGCASWPPQWGSRPCCIEVKPVVRRQPIAWHLFDVTVLEPLEQPFHVLRIGRKLFGSPVRALNLKHGELTESAFFTNRDPATLTPEAVRWGPTRPDDLPVPPLQVTRPKTEGKTPGLFVTDARGIRYLLKFDPVDAPELLSGAEVVTSKLLYALGYHVPVYEVVFFHPEDFQMDPDAEELRLMLEPRLHEGAVRVGVTKILEGDILGPAPFKRFRDCAEMRALKVAYAWVNNIDTKDHNSLLVWDGTQTTGYLIDFGTSLGADAGRAGPKNPCAGRLNVVDLQAVSLKLLTLGFHRPQCDPKIYEADASIGFLSPQVNPERWKPYAPNLAFKEMTRDDGRWMARRLARLSQPQIQAAVAAGQYRKSADAAYLADLLEQRRLSIIDYYLEKGD